MPTLFAEHELKHAINRIAAATSDDAQVLRDHLDKVVKDDEKRHSAEAIRAQKRKMAIEDERLHPVVDQVNGSLRRLGISIEAAADIAVLDNALTDRRWSQVERMRPRAMLHQVGVI